jgi:hypothetical protein
LFEKQYLKGVVSFILTPEEETAFAVQLHNPAFLLQRNDQDKSEGEK